ncbi:MAG: chemotaxis protein CheX [Patescibacteria group bacterium]|nr:chemotaxis protein CheX [Patescibacteria group bacterium]
MRAEYINPFISSLGKSFKTMLGCEVRRGQLMLHGQQTQRFGISGIIGLSGKAVGMVVLSLSDQVALKATSAMLMCETTEINADVIDAVGELTNMVAGAAKAELEEFDMQVSLPNVVTGADHSIRFPSDVTPICVPFSTDWGDLMLEVGLAPVSQPVLA